MKIKLESVYVSDLGKALSFYTNVLGFVKKKDIPMGDTRYVTLMSPDEPDGSYSLNRMASIQLPRRTRKRSTTRGFL